MAFNTSEKLRELIKTKPSLTAFKFALSNLVDEEGVISFDAMVKGYDNVVSYIVQRIDEDTYVYEVWCASTSNLIEDGVVSEDLILDLKNNYKILTS